MFEFCSTEIKGIEFFFISKEIMISLRDETSFLSKRFDPSNLYYLPGTKSFHHYTPVSTKEIGVKRVSTDRSFEFIFNFEAGSYRNENAYASVPVAQPAIKLSGGEYVLCKYEGKQRVGVVLSVDDDAREASIQFMHPPLPSKSFYWAARIDRCDIPFPLISMELSPPTATTSSGRTYALAADDLRKVQMCE